MRSEPTSGMFFTIAAVTRDRKLSAQFEHPVGVTEDGVEIFTASPTGLDKPPYA